MSVFTYYRGTGRFGLNIDHKIYQRVYDFWVDFERDRYGFIHSPIPLPGWREYWNEKAKALMEEVGLSREEMVEIHEVVIDQNLYE